MKTIDLYDKLSERVALRFSDNEHACYSDGEFYINKAFFSVEEAIRFANWIIDLTKET